MAKYEFGENVVGSPLASVAGNDKPIFINA